MTIRIRAPKPRADSASATCFVARKVSAATLSLNACTATAAERNGLCRAEINRFVKKTLPARRVQARPLNS